MIYKYKVDKLYKYKQVGRSLEETELQMKNPDKKTGIFAFRLTTKY